MYTAIDLVFHALTEYTTESTKELAREVQPLPLESRENNNVKQNGMLKMCLLTQEIDLRGGIKPNPVPGNALSSWTK